MAEEVVVKEPLWPHMEASGKELTARLDAAQFELVASFWFFMSEANDWRLMLASPMVDTAGPKAAYSAVQKALDPPLEGLSLHKISVVSPTLPIVQLLMKTIRTDATATSSIRLTRNRINDMFIEDAYIYRMAA
jgi:hypothetical protein